MRLVGVYDRWVVGEEVLNKGGVGVIRPTGDPGFVFKEYLDVSKAPRLSDLRRLVEVGRDVLLRQRLAVGSTPESSINWPVDVVLRDASDVPFGVVLPAIPASLMNEDGKPRGLEFLIMARAGPPVAKARVVLLLRMAEILAYLDQLWLIHGDINSKNLVWTVRPSPVVYLIDCDGMVPRDPAPVVGVQALGWTDPRVMDRLIPAHDHKSDWYALALAMYRGLLLVPGALHQKKSDGTWPVPSRIPEGLDDGVAGLLRQALCRPLDGDARPRPTDWVQALQATYLPAGAYAEAALSRLDQLAQREQTVPFSPLPPTDWAETVRTPPRPSPPRRPVRPPPPQQQPSPPTRPATPLHPTQPPPPALPTPSTFIHRTGTRGRYNATPSTLIVYAILIFGLAGIVKSVYDFVTYSDPSSVVSGSTPSSTPTEMRTPTPVLSATMTPNGPPATVTFTAPEQTAKVSFQGKRNQYVNLQIEKASAVFSIFAPGATVPFDSGEVDSGEYFSGAINLPDNGIYTVEIDPQDAGVEELNISLYDIPPKTIEIIPGDDPIAVDLAPGQTARLIFDVIEARSVSLKIQGDCCAWAKLYNPDGYLVGEETTADTFLEPRFFAREGKYALVVNPEPQFEGDSSYSADYRGWVDVHLYDVHPIIDTIVLNGPPVTVDLAKPGQIAMVSFEGQANQSVSLTITVTGCCIPVSLDDPDGRYLDSAVVGIRESSIAVSETIGPMLLSDDGTYTITVDPNFADTGEATLTLSGK